MHLQINLKYRNYIIIGIFIVLVLGVLYFLTYPLYSKITQGTKNLYDKRVSLAIYQQQRTNAEQTQRDYNSIKNDTASISKIFITKEHIFDLVSAMENIATTHNLTQDIKLDPNHQLIGSDKILAMNITLNGQWSDCLNYLHDLGKLDTYVVVKDLIIEKNVSGITMQLAAESYSY